MTRFLAAAAIAGSIVAVAPALAADAPSLIIKDHVFSPDTLEIPANKRIELTITNADASAEEFDSPDLHVEKMVPAGQTTKVFIGPLDPGTYDFVGELHEETARGTLVAK